VAKPADPTKAGYNFAGWYLGDAAWNFETDKVTKPITLVAKWDEQGPTLYTVTFNTDGGRPLIDSEEVPAGEKVLKPARIPYKEHYVFKGWYVGNEEFDFENTAINSDITITAKWEKMAEVVFDVRGGSAIDPLYVEKGKKVTKPEDPTREGYNFLGWLLDGQAYDFDAVVEDDLLLVASWEEKEYVTITLIADGGEPAPESPVQHEKGTVFLQPAAMTKAGYNFDGWYLGDEKYNFNLPVESNLILIAKWTRVYANYTVTFDIGYEGGEEIDAQTVQEEDKATEPTVEDRVGYRFMGWFEEGATEPYDFDAMVLRDLHLVAQWHLEHVVTFDIGYDEGTNPAPVLVLDGDKVSAPSIAAREFYQFDGWFLGEATEPFDFAETPITETIHLVARWTELETYEITYHNTTDDMFVYGTKEAMVEAFLLDFYDFVKSPFSISDFMHGPGKTSGFDGLWNEANDKIYGGPRPEPGAYNDTYFVSSYKYMDKWLPFFDMIHEFVLIVNPTQFFFGGGVWTGKIRLRQYICNIRPGGKETAEDMYMMPDPLISNPPVKQHLGTDAIQLLEPYREDATFLGWYDNAELTGDPITEIPANTKEDKNVYAKWDEMERFDVTFDIGYAGGESPATQSVIEGHKATKPADPARRPGYRFEGWFEEDATEAFDFTAPIMGPVALTAKWREVVEYQVTFDYDMDDVEDLIVWVEEGEEITPPADPERLNYKFLGWFLEDATEAFDFETIITEDTVLIAHWEELSVFTITYNLPEGGELFPGFSTRNEMLQAFMEDFYEFLVAEGHLTDETITANDFIHGKDKTSGFDGMYLQPAEETSYFQKLYVVVEGVANLGIAPETGAFINQPEYNALWLPLMDQIEEYSQLAGDAGFYGSKYIGYRRFKEYLQGKNLWSGKAEEAALIFATIPNAYVVPKLEFNKEDETFYLPQATHPILEFNGWYDNAEFDGEPVVTIEKGTIGNIELFANFGIPLERYKVEFKLGYDDLTLPDVHINEGNNVPKPTDPSRYLYKFLGWALEGEEELFDFDVTIIDSNIVLVAQWEKLEEMTVSFNLGYEGAPAMDDEIVGQGTTVAKPADPVREGYIFLGWFLEDEEYDFNLPVETDITLVAHWEFAPFELTFDLDGGYLNALDLVEFMENTLVKADKYTNTVDWSGKPLILGHTFAGTAWSKMGFKETEIPGVYELVGKGTGYVNANATMYLSYHDSLEGDYVAIIKEIYKNIEVGDLMIIPNLPAELIDEEVELYFLKSGVSIPTELSVIPENITELITPVRDGYTFVGWYDNAELSGEALVEVPTLTDDLTVYPKWEMNLPKLENAGFTVDSNGNLVFTLEASGANLYSLEIDHNFEGILPEFTIYADNDQVWGTPNEDPAGFGVGATYLNGVWTITFTKGGTAYDTILNSGKSSLRFYFVIANDLGDEWGSMDPTTPENTREIDIVTVSFDVEEADQILFAGDKAVEPATPTKEGFLFAGWAVAEEEFNFSTAVTENILITALWNEVETVKVTFDLNYEGSAEAVVEVIEENTKVTKPADPAREGYVFLGWFEAEAENSFDFDTLVEDDLALEARWLEIVDYTITYELNGGTLPDGFATRDEMSEAFLTDFYNYLVDKAKINSEEILLDDFIHGTGKTSGFDGIYNNYTADLRTLNDKTVNPAGGFLNQAEYNAKWLTLAEVMHEYVGLVNATQAGQFWSSNFTTTNRLKPFFMKTSLGEVKVGHEILERIPLEYTAPKFLYNILETPFNLPLAQKLETEFLGWYLDAEFTGDALTAIPAEQTGNLTLYARWQESTYYEVTFDSNGGSEVPSAQVEEGLLVLEPVDPTKENYVFVGWFVPDAETAYDFNTPVIADLVLEARWEEAEVVIYDLGEYGYLSEEDKESLLWDFVGDYKEFYGRTGATQQELYDNFAGKSYIAAPYDIKDIFQPEYKNGKWTWLYEYLVYMAEKTSYEELAALSSYTLLTLRTNIHGFILEEQYTLASSTSMDFTTEDAINGFWRFTSYNKVVKAEEDPLLDGNTISLWKEGYEFAGWYDNPEFEGEAITEIPAILDGHYKLYAKWDEVVLPSIDEVRDLATGTATEFIGIVTGIDGKNLFVQDATAAIYIYNVAALPEGLAIGDEVRIAGNRAVFNGLEQISGATVTIESSDNDLPALLEVTDLTSLTAADQAKRVEIEGLTVKSQSGSNLVLTDGTNDILVYAASGSAIYNHIQDAIAGQTVIVHEAYIGWYSGLQLTILEVADLEFVELSDELKAAAAKEALALPAVATIEGLTLPEAGLHGTAITWESSHEEIIDIDGTVVLPVETTVVTLTATITLGEVTLTKEFEVTVYHEGAVIPVTVEAVFTDHGTNVPAGDITSMFGLDENIFDIHQVNNDAQSNMWMTATEVRLYSVRATGEGTELVFEVAEGYKILSIEFTVLANYNPAAEVFVDNVSHNVYSDYGAEILVGELSATTVSIKNVHEGGSKNIQLRIGGIKITYVAVE
jgi:uncharacterized repeat protein (TIGR02543 family)